MIFYPKETEKNWVSDQTWLSPRVWSPTRSNLNSEVVATLGSTDPASVTGTWWNGAWSSNRAMGVDQERMEINSLRAKNPPLGSNFSPGGATKTCLSFRPSPISRLLTEVTADLSEEGMAHCCKGVVARRWTAAYRTVSPHSTSPK